MSAVPFVVARVSVAVVAVVAAVLAGPSLVGQTADGERLRMLNGQPDLQGVWRFSTITPW